MHSPRYHIATVAKMTGLSTDLIRAWERRYGVVRPVRADNGVRLYGDEEVRRLELLRAAVTLGHPIRSAAVLTNEDLQGLLEARGAQSAQAGLQNVASQKTVLDVLHAVRDYDLSTAESLLHSAALFFTPTELVLDVLAPLMHAIGRGWEEETISVAQEHFTSHLVRNVLGNIFRLRAPVREERMLFATPPGEAHELGILFAAALASLRGFSTLILGANVPLNELVRTAQKTRPEIIVLGVVHQANVEERCAYVNEAAKRCEAVWLGGEAASSLPAAQLAPTVRTAETLLEFSSRLHA